MSPVPKDALGDKPDLRAKQSSAALPAELEADVVIVGAGAGGLAAANAAAAHGAEVIVIEAGETVGGTTVKSSGGVLVFNNRFHREAGIEEDREQSIRMMAKTSFPDSYDADADGFGLEPRDLELIETYYDSSGPAFEALEAEGTLTLAPQNGLSGDPRGFPSYFTDLPEETIVYGRTLTTRTPDGMEGYGRELIRQLLGGAERKGARVLPGYRVKEILRDDDQVVGVEAEGPDGARRFLARKAVIFATGGFTHNRELMDRHMPGYVPGGGAASHSRGDFVSLTEDLDVELAHMDKVWLGEVPVEFAIQSPETPLLLFIPFGDSMLYVDSKGRRSVNEKLPYDRRGQLHFVTDENGEQPNKLLFMIYDRAVAGDPNALSPTRWPVPAAGESAAWVIEAPTLEELESELRERLARIADETGGVQLEPEFGEELSRAIARFNSHAESGRDEDFGRGELPIEVDTTGMTRPGSHPNPTMYPIAPQGPYYAVILAAGTLDTKGGPRTDSVGRVLRSDGSPIVGLYGVGNCVASPSAGAYWSGGNTLGIACTFGYLAGSAVARQASRDLAALGAGVS